MAPADEAADHDAPSSAQQNMFEESSGKSTKSEGKSNRGSAHLKGTRSLERLRDRIDLAVKELGRLRDENAELQKKLSAAKSPESESVEGTTVVFSESPSALRTRVENCIEAIDRYLDGATVNPSQDE